MDYAEEELQRIYGLSSKQMAEFQGRWDAMSRSLESYRMAFRWQPEKPVETRSVAGLLLSGESLVLFKKLADTFGDAEAERIWKFIDEAGYERGYETAAESYSYNYSDCSCGGC